MNKLPENWGVKCNGELEFYHVLAYLNCHHGCNFTKSSGFKGYTFGVINDKDKGIVSPFKVKNMFSLDQFIELSKERTVVYGVIYSNGANKHWSIFRPLHFTIEGAIEDMHKRISESKTTFKKLSDTHYKGGYYRFYIEEFELI